jgi:hypothetical protein
MTVEEETGHCQRNLALILVRLCSARQKGMLEGGIPSRHTRVEQVAHLRRGMYAEYAVSLRRAVSRSGIVDR